jgi:hypothetical protein
MTRNVQKENAESAHSTLKNRCDVKIIICHKFKFTVASTESSVLELTKERIIPSCCDKQERIKLK